MYTVIEHFTDLQDHGFKYHVGDVYPHMGYKPNNERIKELLSGNNKRGRAVIAEIVEEQVDIDPAEIDDSVAIVAEEKPAAEKPKRKGRKKNAE